MRKVIFVMGFSLAVGSLYGWNGAEHVEIGTEGYSRACMQARALYDTAEDFNLVQRLKLACEIVGERIPRTAAERNFLAFTYAPLAGEWSRLAADHTDSPDQLTSVRLGDLVVGYGRMVSIAVNNTRHFYPLSVTSWRDDHTTALVLAKAAAGSNGIELAERFERALAAESFAQHYLQDSFAAGHMGFNRIASSNATALAYHKRMNTTGRCVANGDGEAWFTFGDDHLHPLGAAAEHVVDASAASFLDFLQAFVQGVVQPEGWHTVWDKLPATFSDKITAESSCAYAPGWPTLRNVGDPAPGVSTFEIFTIMDSSFYRPAPRALMLGMSRDLGSPLMIGYRAIHTRFFAAAGGTIHQIGPREFWADWGYAAQVGTSTRGTVTHEIGISQSIAYNPHNSEWFSYRNSSFRLLYAARIEAGPIFFRVQTGVAYSGHGGPVFGTGVGWVSR